MTHRPHGFTLVELIVTLILIGILAVAVLPRINVTGFSENGFRDGVKAALQHARKTAVASRRFVCASTTANSITLSRNLGAPESLGTPVACTGAGTGTIAIPAPVRGCAANAVCSTTPGVAITTAATTIIFDPLGRPVDSGKTALAADTVINFSGGLSITIRAESGAVQ